MDKRKQNKYDQLYMRIAFEVANMSYAKRSKVGAVIVRDGCILSMGWNGMPYGWNNVCEHTNPIKCQHCSKSGLDIKLCTNNNCGYSSFEDTELFELKTKKEVLHAEANAITKLAKSTEHSMGATLYTTYSPCIECTKLILQSGISQVVYLKEYRDDYGKEMLEKANIQIRKIQLDERA